MYGGTCINIGCLPSKSLILDAERAHFLAKVLIQTSAST